MFEKDDFIVKCNVVEEHEVLANLAHVSNMWNDGKSEFLGHHGNENGFANTSSPQWVNLDKTN